MNKNQIGARGPGNEVVIRLCSVLLFLVFQTMPVYAGGGKGPQTTAVPPEEKKVGRLEYKITGGHYLPLCEELLRHANQLPPPVPGKGQVFLVLPFKDKMPDIRTPKWTELDPNEHIKKVRYFASAELNPHSVDISFAEAQSGPVVFDPDDPFREAYEKRQFEKFEKPLAEGMVRFASTRMDFDHDGKAETVYRLALGHWAGVRPSEPPENRFLYGYHVMPRDIDVPMARDFVSGDVELAYLLRSSRGSSGELLYYQGRSLLIGTGFGGGGPSVIQPQGTYPLGGGPTAACSFHRKLPEED